MKKILLCLSLAITIATIQANETITIGASPTPHALILKQVRPILAAQGIDLQITEFSDYVTPNLAVSQNKLDANYFQTKPYLAQFNKNNGTKLVDLVDVHIEPMGVYATPSVAAFAKSKKIADLPPGSKIGVPNEATSEKRAFTLLQNGGLIKVKPGVEFPTKKDIISNPNNLNIIELDPAMLPRAYTNKQVDLAVINSNYALQIQLNPVRDAIFIEPTTSPYVNLIALRPEELNDPKMKALAKAITSPAIKAYIKKQFGGAVVPAF